MLASGARASASASTATAPFAATSNGFASSDVEPRPEVVRGSRDRLDRLRHGAEVVRFGVEAAARGLLVDEPARLLRR